MLKFIVAGLILVLISIAVYFYVTQPDTRKVVTQISDIANQSSPKPSITPFPSEIPNILPKGNGLNTFTADYATFSFDFPENWQVKETFRSETADYEVYHNIEVKDNDGELILYFTRPHFADGCDSLPKYKYKDIDMQIGFKKQTLKPVCGFLLGSFSEFHVSIFFVGSKNETAGRELLKSLH